MQAKDRWTRHAFTSPAIQRSGPSDITGGYPLLRSPARTTAMEAQPLVASRPRAPRKQLALVSGVWFLSSGAIALWVG